MVGRVGGDVDAAVGEGPGEQPDQGTGQLDRAGTAFTGPQPKQDRQADWSAAHRQCHDQADDDPPVAAGGHVARLGTVMSPERVVDRLAAPAKQRVVDRHL